jgi:hypothetical protein
MDGHSFSTTAALLLYHKKRKKIWEMEKPRKMRKNSQLFSNRKISVVDVIFTNPNFILYNNITG